MEPELNINSQNNVSENSEVKKEGRIGPIIGSVIIIILIVIAGFYYLSSVAEKKLAGEQNNDSIDAVGSLETELSNPELENLEQDIDSLEKEIDEELNNL